MESIGTGSGGYCVTLVYPIPLLPSGPGGVFRLQLHSPPKPVRLSGLPLKRREWDSNPRWSYPHTRFPSVLLKPLGHLSRTFRLYHRFVGRSRCPGKIPTLHHVDMNSLRRQGLQHPSQVSCKLAIINSAEPLRILLELR